MQRDESLLVLGAAGGVGLAAVEIGRVLGARVIAAASNDEKLAVCREHGADDTINYASENLRQRIEALTGGRGVDVVYDPVGGAFSESALRDMAWGGRYLVVGFAAAEIPRVPLNLPLLKGCSIVGVFWGRLIDEDPASRARVMSELLRLHAEEKIRPRVSARFPFERAADALNAVLQRKVTGKVVLQHVHAALRARKPCWDMQHIGCRDDGGFGMHAIEHFGIAFEAGHADLRRVGGGLRRGIGNPRELAHGLQTHRVDVLATKEAGPDDANGDWIHAKFLNKLDHERTGRRTVDTTSSPVE